MGNGSLISHIQDCWSSTVSFSAVCVMSASEYWCTTVKVATVD